MSTFKQTIHIAIRRSKPANIFIEFLIRLTSRFRRTAHVVGVRPEVAALIECNMDDRPDLWRDLAKR